MKGIFCSFISLLLFSCSGNSGRKTYYTDAAPKPIGPYSQAVKSGGFVFVSGQIALNKEGKLDTSSIENETRLVMENVRSLVEEAGLQMKDICKASIFTTDLKYFQAINQVYGSYFASDPPARETVQVAALPKGARVEISVILVTE